MTNSKEQNNWSSQVFSPEPQTHQPHDQYTP